MANSETKFSRLASSSSAAGVFDDCFRSSRASLDLDADMAYAGKAKYSLLVAIFAPFFRHFARLYGKLVRIKIYLSAAPIGGYGDGAK